MKNISLFLMSLLSIFIALLNSLFTMCLCGHLSMASLPGSMIAAGLSWFVLIKYKTAAEKKSGDTPPFSILRAIVFWPAVVITTLVLFKTICDILWTGHEPLFP